jgi:hypothetical protein
MNLATRYILFRADLLRRKAARERRRRLWQELAEYSSPSLRADFEAMLDRYPDGVTWEMRDILERQAEERRFPAIGRT